VYRIFGIDDHDNVWQIQQFLDLCGIRKMVEGRRERFVDGWIDSSKYGVVLEVMVSNLTH